MIRFLNPVSPPLEIADVLAVVTLPLASTTIVGMDEEPPYVPDVTPLVARVAVPWLIVKSPARVVERFPIVPAVLLIDPLKVPPVIVAVLEVSVWIVPFVMLAAVDVVVPAVSVGIVPIVMLAVLEVRLGIVPVVIVALVETVRFPVAVPKVNAPVRFRFV